MLETIKKYKAKHGYEPNEYELARMGEGTRVTVRRKLQKLEDQGLIKRIEVPARGHYELIPK